MCKDIECAKCGTCCKAIIIKQSVETIQRWKESNTCIDADFILEHWHPITKEEALKINPYLENWDDDGGIPNFYYTCDALNADTNLCTMHNERPKVCSGFPYYGGIPLSKHGYTETCTFWVNHKPAVDKEVEWADLDKVVVI